MLLLGETVELEDDGQLQLAGASICRASSGSVSENVSSTSGWRALKCASAGGSSEALAVENEASRTRPPRTPAIASSSASAAASLASTTWAWSTSARPASVS